MSNALIPTLHCQKRESNSGKATVLSKNLGVRNSNNGILSGNSREKLSVERSPEPHGPILRVAFSLGPVTVEPLVGSLVAALGLVMTLAPLASHNASL